MHIVIDQFDLQRLSPTTREEILRFLRPQPAAPRGGQARTGKAPFRWRAPYDLTPQLARKLVRGLSAESKERLRLFARDGGRATMRELMAIGGDDDLRALSTFEGAVTRKLRRLVGDEEKIASLIMWDYDTERWDDSHTRLVDGVYYVSAATAAALRDCFHGA